MLEWSVFVLSHWAQYVIHLALSKTLDCLQYLHCTTVQSIEELCASGTEMNNSQRALVRVKLCAFQEINCGCTLPYTNTEQSHGLYKKPTNHHMNV